MCQKLLSGKTDDAVALANQWYCGGAHYEEDAYGGTSEDFYKDTPMAALYKDTFLNRSP